MSSEQKSIYYMLGENKDALKNAPLLEKFAQKGFDVLLLSDEIDAIVMPMVGEYDKTPLRSINSKEALEELGEETIDEATQKAYEPLIKNFKDALGEQISEVKLSSLVVSPLHISHPLFEKLKSAQEDKIKQSALLLFGAALVLEGGTLNDAKAFNTELNNLLLQSL